MSAPHENTDSQGSDSKPSGLPPIPEAEREFLARYDASAFPHPSVSVDVALVTASEGQLRALLVQRDQPPYRHYWSLPGGFVRLDESLDAAATRLLATKAGIAKEVFLEQLYTFGQPARDPRTRVISVAYYALVDAQRLATARDQAASGEVSLAPLQVPWEGEEGGLASALDMDGAELPLAFDHAAMLGMLVKRLRGKLAYAPIGFELLPTEFPLRALQEVHETILGRPLNKDSFRRRMLASGRLEATGQRERDVEHRPAALYRFSGAPVP